jgi:hypothetical protein
MEWAKMDIGELLGNLEDEEDLTDQHWKRSTNNQPTTSGTGHQDTCDEQYQVTELRRPGTTHSSHLVCTFCAATSLYSPRLHHLTKHSFTSNRQQGEEIHSGEEFHLDSPSYKPPQRQHQSFMFGLQQPSYQQGSLSGQPVILVNHT